MRRPPSTSVGINDLTSLEERLGLLLMVRLGLIAMVVLGAILVPTQVGFHIGNVGPISLAYLVVATGAEAFRRTRRRGSMLLHRAVLPLDSVYLALMTTPSGGPRSQLVVLFAVQLIAVTLLASQRTGVRVALWDTFLFIVIPTLSLSGRMATLLGLRVVAAPPASETALAIMGFWVVAVCTAFFSSVSERELRRHKAELESLAAMAAKLERVQDEEESFAVLLSTVAATFPFRRGVVWWTRGDTRRGLAFDARADGTVEAIAVDPAAPLDRVAAEVRGSREPRLLKRLDPVQDSVADSLLPGAHNVVAYPLPIEGDDSGLLLLEHGGHPLEARLPRRTLVMLGEFSIHAVLSVNNARLLAERERLATIDGLTGLANRREFDQVLTREVNRCARSGEPLSLVVVDVDHFKRINDTRGHLAGDEVLRSLAGVLSTAMREMDLVARYGGEEFAVVLPRCDQIDAVRVVRRFTSLMRRCPGLEGVTVSSGIATMPDNVSGAEELIAAADEALYESKRAGRDRYTISSRATKRRAVDLLERS